MEVLVYIPCIHLLKGEIGYLRNGLEMNHNALEAYYILQ